MQPLMLLQTVNRYLSNIVSTHFEDLSRNYCVELGGGPQQEIEATTLGRLVVVHYKFLCCTEAHTRRIASYYYLHYTSVGLFASSITESNTMEDLLQVRGCAQALWGEIKVVCAVL